MEEIIGKKEEKVILLDKEGNDIGSEEKIKAHEDALLHRAFSVFLINSEGKILLQKRAATKYHSGGLWSNTCCGHPRPGESIEQGAMRRLKEEMEIECNLKKSFDFFYSLEFDNGLTEKDHDHVLIGSYEFEPIPNGEEFDAWQWTHPKDLKEMIESKPHMYTPWLRKIMKDHHKKIRIN